MYHNYQQIPALAESLKPFSGNRISGGYPAGDRSQYFVFSYNMLIGKWDAIYNRYTIYTRRVSNTTSRHQNLLKRAWANNPNLVIKED